MPIIVPIPMHLAEPVHNCLQNAQMARAIWLVHGRVKRANDSGKLSLMFDNQEHLDYLKTCDREFLEEFTVGIDRGIAIPVQADSVSFDFDPNQKRHAKKAKRKIKHLQRKLTREQKGSKRRNKTKRRLAKNHAKLANIRMDFSHKTSRTIVNGNAKVIILEDLHIASMLKRPKPKQDAQGRYLHNKAKQKAGLNEAIHNVSWYLIEACITYKAYRAGKAVFKIPAAYTSQECAKCGYTHPDNRKTQASFVCGNCEHTDNADHNAAEVIKKRAIKLILDSGTELSEDGVLRLKSDIGREGRCKTSPDKGSSSSVRRSVKREETTSQASVSFVVLQARAFRHE